MTFMIIGTILQLTSTKQIFCKYVWWARFIKIISENSYSKYLSSILSTDTVELILHVLNNKKKHIILCINFIYNM